MRKPVLFMIGTILSGTLFFSCSKDDTNIDDPTDPVVEIPSADFSVSQSIVNEGVAVTFTDLSENKPTEWSWEFTGGTPANSTEQNPLVTYNAPGIYGAKLTASNTAGSSTETKLEYIIVVPVSGLVAYYPLDGDFYDYSGNGYNAINSGVVFGTDVSGNENMAASFADSTYFEIANNDDLNFDSTDFSVSMWLISASSSTQMVFQKGGLNAGADPQYWLRLNDSNGEVTFLTGDGTAPSVLTYDTVSVSDSIWHHVVVQRSGQNVQLFVDMELVSEAEGEIENVTSDQSLKFGIQILTDYNHNGFVGLMDEIRIYNEALTDEEIGILNSLK